MGSVPSSLRFPRLGCAIAWGYHSVRQLRRLVECFLSRIDLVAAKSCAVPLWRMTENRHNLRRRSFRHTRRWRGGFACLEHWLQSSRTGHTHQLREDSPRGRMHPARGKGQGAALDFGLRILNCGLEEERAKGEAGSGKGEEAEVGDQRSEVIGRSGTIIQPAYL